MGGTNLKPNMQVRRATEDMLPRVTEKAPAEEAKPTETSQQPEGPKQAQANPFGSSRYLYEAKRCKSRYYKDAYIT